MKALALAAAVTAGTLLTAGTADAQFRARRGGGYSSYSYSVPSYSYSNPSYGYSYAAPSYYSNNVVTSGYTVPYASSGTVITSGYTPSYGTSVYPSGYYAPSTWNSPYSNGGFYNSYYNNGYYNNGYNNGINITPSGVNVGGRSLWRW